MLDNLLQGKMTLANRMRLQCNVIQGNKIWEGVQAMNEVSIHRGSHPYLTGIACYVDDAFLTDIIVIYVANHRLMDWLLPHPRALQRIRCRQEGPSCILLSQGLC